MTTFHGDITITNGLRFPVTSPPEVHAADAAVLWANAAGLQVRQGDIVAPVIHPQWQSAFAQSLSVSATSGDTEWHSKVVLTLPQIPAGTLLLFWAALWQIDTTNAARALKLRLTKGGVSVWEMISVSGSANTNLWHPTAGSYAVEITAVETPVITLDYGALHSSPTAAVKSATITALWRENDIPIY